MLRTLAILSGAGSEWTVSPFRSQGAGSYFQSSRAASCRSSSERGRQWRGGTRKVSRELRPHFMHLVASGSICGSVSTRGSTRSPAAGRSRRLCNHPPDLLKTRQDKLALFLDGQSAELRKDCERHFHPEPVGIGVFDHLVKRVAIRFGFVVYDLQLAVEIDFRNDSFFLVFDDAAPPCDKDFLPRFQFVGPPARCPEGFRCLEKASRIGDENEESLQLGVRKLRLKNTVPANPGELFAGRFQRRFVRGAGHASAP